MAADDASLLAQAKRLMSDVDELGALVGSSPEARRGARVILGGILRGSLAPLSPLRADVPAAPSSPLDHGDRPIVAGE